MISVNFQLILYENRSDILTETEAVCMLKDNEAGKDGREAIMRTLGYPAYTTQVGK